MSAYTPDPGQERAQSISNLYTDPRRPEVLDRLLAETNDNPALELTGLDPRMTQRISARFIVSTQVGRYAEEAANLLDGVDYALLDTSYDGSQRDKRLRDVARNLAFNGIRLSIATSGEPGIARHDFRRIGAGLSDTDPVADAFVNSVGYQRRTVKPVVRTIGLGLQDRMPDDDRMTLEGTRAAIRELGGNYESKVFAETNDELLERLKAIFRITTPELTAMDQQLRSDISTIVASAVVRHPRKEMTFGVVLNARYHEVARGLLAYSGLFRRLEIEYAPFMGTRLIDYLPSAEDKAERETARGKTPPMPALKRVLLAHYVQEALSEKLDDEKTMRLTREFESGLADRAVDGFLQAIDRAKSEPLSSFNLRRQPMQVRQRSKVLDRVWQYPSIVTLRQNRL